MKSKVLFPKIIDFLIALFILASVIFTVRFANNILYEEKSAQRSITLITEPISKEITDKIKPEDPIYDNLTKKLIGNVSYVSETDLGESVVYRISIVSDRKPRGDSLRTKTLWFRYTEV